MKRQVAVFEHLGKRKILLTAYTLWYNPSWEGCCLHTVDSDNGKEAKRQAMDEHFCRCMHSDDSLPAPEASTPGGAT